MNTGSRSKYLVKNIALFTLANMATKFINFLLVPLYTHVLTTEEYGVVDLIITTSIFVAPILIANIGESVLRFPMNMSENPEHVMSVGLLCFLGSLVLGLLLIPIAEAIPILAPYSVYLYMFTISFSAYQLVTCYLRGKENTVAFSICTILNTFLHCVFNVFLLLCLNRGIKGYLEAYIAANLITVALAFKLGDIGAVIRNFHIERRLTKAMLVYAVVMIPNVFMWWIMDSMDKLVITAVLGVAANGIFAIAYKIPSFLSTIASTFNQAWLYSAVQENNSSDRDEYTSLVFNTFFALIILSAAGMIMVLKPFLKIYVSSQYYIAWKYTPFLIMGFVFSSLGTFLSSYYNVNFDGKGFLYSVAVGTVINVVLNIALIVPFGMIGVALATSISYISVFLYRYFDTKKYVTVHVFSAKNIIVFTIMTIMVASIYIPSAYGQILCCIEFMIIFGIELKTFLPILKKTLKKVLHR